MFVPEHTPVYAAITPSGGPMSSLLDLGLPCGAAIGSIVPQSRLTDNGIEVERAHSAQVLEETNWVIEGAHGAAMRLSLKPGTLRGRMRKLGIVKGA